MKYCPNCSRSYDDQIRYCYLDGATLLAGDIPRVNSGDGEFYPREYKSDPGVPGSGVNMKSPLTYLFIGCLTTALVAALIVLAFRDSVSIRSDGGDKAVISPAVGYETPLSSPATSTPTATDLETGRMQREILETLEAWRQAAERRDLRTYMAFYAQTIDYYKKPRSSKESVEADKKRYFDKNQSAAIRLSNIDITLSDQGMGAAVHLDKEWIFNSDTGFSGKVRGEFGMRNIGGRWLIVSEKDVKVIYVNR